MILQYLIFGLEQIFDFELDSNSYLYKKIIHIIEIRENIFLETYIGWNIDDFIVLNLCLNLHFK